MQRTLDRLGIPLVVAWTPDPGKSVHGEIKQNVLCVYDEQPDDVWATFLHEVIEFKLKKVTKVYRSMINSLIEGYENLAYQEKEAFIEFIPKLLDVQKLKQNETPQVNTSKL
jgi:hypothetical protein